MVRTPVTSSQIKSIGHDPETKKLHIEFNGGAVYEYDDVNVELHKSLMEAESHGKHFHTHIKKAVDDNGQAVHAYRKLPAA